MLLLNKFYDTTWLATESSIRQIEEVLQRHQDIKLTGDDLRALETQLGKPLQNNPNIYMRGSTAVIPIMGSIIKKGTMMTEVSGLTSTERIARDYKQAIDDPTVKSIVLDIDSGGGEANSISELGDLIRSESSKKPVYAYSGGSAQSAAYWIGSSVPKGNFVISDTAALGSIGVAVFITDQTEAMAREGVREIVFKSTKTPKKLPDFTTEAGAELIQGKLDSLYEVFRAKVMANRDGKVDPDKLAGASYIGQEAVDAKLADRLGSFEGLIKELNKKEINMDKKTADVTSAEEGSAVMAVQDVVSKEDFQAISEQFAQYKQNVAQAEELRNAKLEEMTQALEDSRQRLLVAEIEGKVVSFGDRLTDSQKPLYTELYTFISSADNSKLNLLDQFVSAQIALKVLTEEQLADEDLQVLENQEPITDSEDQEIEEITSQFASKHNKGAKKA